MNFETSSQFNIEMKHFWFEKNEEKLHKRILIFPWLKYNTLCVNSRWEIQILIR